MHVDCNAEKHILVYPYFKGDLLALIRDDPYFPNAERKKILRHVAEAIKEFHDKGWIHIGNSRSFPARVIFYNLLHGSIQTPETDWVPGN